MTFRIPADPAIDAFYRLRASSNLMDWATIASKDDTGPWTGSATVVTDPVVGGLTRITITETLPPGTLRRYHRLEAKAP